MSNKTVLKRCWLRDVKPGSELGASLLTENGKFALGEGTLLTANIIERLQDWGIDYVTVRVAVGEERKKAPRLSRLQTAVSSEYNGTVDQVKRTFETIRYYKKVPLQELRELADAVLEPFARITGIANHLQVIDRLGEYTFHHSINVAVLSGLLGRWLGYDGDEWRDLILAGLLHDIGKTQVPLEILRKPGELTAAEMEVMKQHTTRGYNLVKDLNLPTGVQCAILQHHEREDGSGYPLQVPGDKIHRFAKIVAVADAYDAMTSETPYRTRRSPFAAAEAVVQSMYNKLDPEICTAFLNNVRDYFIGNLVQLSDGREAEVVYLGKAVSARPVVRAEDGEFIDLEKAKDIGIVKLLRS